MSLAHAVLTSLLEKASSGYDLARRFDKSIGYFWHATHQQIYRELARMEAAGWIASSVPARRRQDPQEGIPGAPRRA
jgi:DNA-binding PadR family transcriptional regulator